MQKRLLHEIQCIRLYLVMTATIATLMGVFVVVQAATLTQVINDVFLARQTLPSVAPVLIILLVAFVGRALLSWGNAHVAAQAAATVKSSLRERLIAQLQALGPLYIKGERSGELAATIVEGVEAVDAFFSQMLPQVCLAVLIPVIIGLVVFVIDPLSGLILLITTPILLFFMYLIGTLTRAYTKKQWALLSRMSAHFLDVLQGLTTLKLFGRSHVQEETIGRVSDSFRETTMHVLRVAFLSSLVLQMGATLSTALVAVEIGLRLLYAHISFSPAFFVLLLTPDFYLPLRTLGAKFHASMSGSAAAERIYEILDLSVPVESTASSGSQQGKHALPEKAPEIHFYAGHTQPISLRNVTYSYSDKESEAHPALHDVSFTIEPGQKVALVGPSGAGKSTIAHLLLRFIEAQSGMILVGEIPLSAIPVPVWRKQVAWISQRPYLFNASIADNIRLGRADATMAEVVEAAQQACIHDFIAALPHGYDTMIGERGARLSGGQAQRLAVARAILKDAPLLILDEATAHLDQGVRH
jgi:ATP-binding cassette, subfamily C, bacterial CydD